MKSLIQLPLMVFLLILSGSGIAQTTDSLQTDSISISLEDYKYIRAWASYGEKCEKAINEKNKQLDKVEVLVNDLANEVQVTKKKNKWLVAGIGVLGVAVVILAVLP